MSNQFELPKLAYSYAALEPHIDARTMQIHYEKHHGAYTTNLNNAVNDNTELAGKSIEYILANISKFAPVVRNNGGGFYNHNLFWEVLSPNAGGVPLASLAIAKKIEADLGSFEEFKKQFVAAALTQFGSGWAWLSVDESGKLFVSATPNQDNPLMDVVAKKGTPILGLDVWEHAYYLNYQNRRADYIASFFNIINWDAVNAKFLSAKK
ncbi:MAG: superoxide dismutase [Bacteroidales bacterium]|nr:superoxide dismutase [Bacteroidales bacterium]